MPPAEHELLHRIPITDWIRPSYRDVPIDASDPRHAEPLVRLDGFGVAYRSYHARSDGQNPPYYRAVKGSRVDMWLRESAAARLQAVNETLRPLGYELLVLDGYRPIACQRELWQFYYDAAWLALDAPTPEACRAHALRSVADPADFSPDDPRTWPVHSTGGCVDLTMRGLDDGLAVDLGWRFEELTETSRPDHFERLLEAGQIAPDDSRLRLRRTLHWAMSSHDWVSDPHVSWHYDWGTQSGVLTQLALHGNGPRAACYGYAADPPPEVHKGPPPSGID